MIEAPCTDDNGAAVSTCLAIGRLAEQAGGFERDLIIAIFDAEEPPYFQSSAMGSIRFAEGQPDDRGVHFAMIYDLVGHDLSIPSSILPGRLAGRDVEVPFLKDLVFVTGSESHPELPSLVGGTPSPQDSSCSPPSISRIISWLRSDSLSESRTKKRRIPSVVLEEGGRASRGSSGMRF